MHFWFGVNCPFKFKQLKMSLFDISLGKPTAYWDLSTPVDRPLDSTLKRAPAAAKRRIPADKSNYQWRDRCLKQSRLAAASRAWASQVHRCLISSHYTESDWKRCIVCDRYRGHEPHMTFQRSQFDTEQFGDGSFRFTRLYPPPFLLLKRWNSPPLWF